MSPRRILILACSQRKRPDAGLLPAIERYDGPPFRVLRRYLREDPTHPPDIYILSAKFGLISGNKRIPAYDQRMTLERAKELHGVVGAQLGQALALRSYTEMLLCVGRDYWKALRGIDGVGCKRVSVTVAAGGQGVKLAKLRKWLDGKPCIQIAI